MREVKLKREREYINIIFEAEEEMVTDQVSDQGERAPKGQGGGCRLDGIQEGPEGPQVSGQLEEEDDGLEGERALPV